jgi:hypothetical protein
MDAGSVSINGTTVAKGALWDAAGIDYNLYRNPDNTAGNPGTIGAGQTYVGQALPAQSAAGPTYGTTTPPGGANLVPVFKNGTARFNAIHDFNVPAGTTIGVTGNAVAVIELYSG